MSIDSFLAELRADPAYAGQIVHMHQSPARQAQFSAAWPSAECEELAKAMGVDRLYSHQAEAIGLVAEGRDVVVASGTSSGKSLCYVLPILEMLRNDAEEKALLLYPTKELCQDQHARFTAAAERCGLGARMCGVFDGDTSPALRRRLRDSASVVLSNPDMIHASLLSRHARWAGFLANLKALVLDEIHVYNGIFGSNMAHLLRRLLRVCAHYGSRPQVVACSATIANPRQLAEELTGRTMALVDRDGSPRGRKVYVLWNPPAVRGTAVRSRRSACVEAHELMSRLVERGMPTITFSKAKMSAELIHRYVVEKLGGEAPQLVSKVTPYRGGYRPEERREIERRLFSGELLGVSSTAALELGIDVGGLDACIVVGYPGTRASFLQQAGRAGRVERESIVFLVGLDTAVNQYVMTHPEYIFERCVEEAVIDPQNPFVVIGHMRCAAAEIPLPDSQKEQFGPFAGEALQVLDETGKLKKLQDTWYHAASEIPQHEVPLRAYADENVVIRDRDTGEILGHVSKFDAQPILHPEAIYMHRGDTYRVLELDTDRNIAHVTRVQTDYYTQPQGGTDVHHIDHQLREKPFGTGTAYWGEVTACFRNECYEKVQFYTLDALSVHGLDLPTLTLETTAFWLAPPEPLMESVRAAGLDAFAGLRGMGYATRMVLPLFMTCDVRSFSHTVGSVNSPWNAVFVYERYPKGLGFTHKAFDNLHAIMPAVLKNVRDCPCEDGCPCCTGKPLRGYTVWNVERGEASIPSKRAALMVLEGLLGDGSNLRAPEKTSLVDSEASRRQEVLQMLRRRQAGLREPQWFHPIRPGPEIRTEMPAMDNEGRRGTSDVGRRAERRRSDPRDFRRRLAGKTGPGGIDPHGGGPEIAAGKQTRLGNLLNSRQASERPEAAKPVTLGDSLAARARRKKRQGG